MFPAIAASMSASLGLGLLVSNALADMIWPDWQYPHCGTSRASQARWILLPAAVCQLLEASKLAHFAQREDVVFRTGHDAVHHLLRRRRRHPGHHRQQNENEYSCAHQNSDPMLK